MRWCSVCQQKVVEIKPPVCIKCGEPINHEGLCRRCINSRPTYNKLRSYALFLEPLRNAIHRLKYKRDLGLGDIFSNYLYNLFQEFNWQIDIIIPVPLSKQRFAERGYNQSALLARPLAWGLNIRYDSKAISRNRDTLSQVGLNIIQRRENVKGAFTAIKHRVIDKNILLIDDVITSGATIEACSQALIEVGAKSVYGLTLARAVLTK